MGLIEWQNLIFLLPMALAMLYVLLMAVGLSVGEHGHVDVGHVDVGHVDVGHVDVGHDLGGHGADAGDVDHSHLLGAALSFLGIGKVPLSILMLSACLIWGSVGLVLNVLLGTASMWPVVGFTALAAMIGTRLVAEGLSAVMPGEESYHTPKEQLVGEIGEVLYEITPTSGSVRLRDPSGNLLDLDCRAYGEDHIPAGIQVVLEEYNASADLFFVRTGV